MAVHGAESGVGGTQEQSLETATWSLGEAERRPLRETISVDCWFWALLGAVSRRPLAQAGGGGTANHPEPHSEQGLVEERADSTHTHTMFKHIRTHLRMLVHTTHGPPAYSTCPGMPTLNPCTSHPWQGSPRSHFTAEARETPFLDHSHFQSVGSNCPVPSFTKQCQVPVIMPDKTKEVAALGERQQTQPGREHREWAG